MGITTERGIVHRNKQQQSRRQGQTEAGHRFVSYLHTYSFAHGYIICVRIFLPVIQQCYKRKRKRTKKGRSLERMTTAHTLALNEERKRDRSTWKHAGTTPSLESLIGVQSRRLRERVNIRDPVCGSCGICGSIYVTKT